MAWRYRERRRRKRGGESEPTYLVERDAPEWKPPAPFWREWVRKAQERVERNRYDAYPDHTRPFDGWTEPEALPPVPDVDRPAIEARLPKPSVGRVRLMVATDKRMKRLLGPWSLDRLDLSRRATQAWVLGEIARAVEELTREED